MVFNKSKNQEDDQSKNKKRGNTAHHPLLKYVSNKNKEANYTSQINRLESLYEKIRKSTSKVKARHSVVPTSTNKKQRGLSISLKKNHIKLDSQIKNKKIEKPG